MSILPRRPGMLDYEWHAAESTVKEQGLRIAELERDHSALMDAYKEMSDRAFSAEGRVAELERIAAEKVVERARREDELTAEIERLKHDIDRHIGIASAAEKSADILGQWAKESEAKRQAAEAECERLRGSLLDLNAACVLARKFRVDGCLQADGVEEIARTALED